MSKGGEKGKENQEHSAHWSTHGIRIPGRK